MPITIQLTTRTAALIAPVRTRAACAVSSGIHRNSRSDIGPTILSRPERLLDALHNRVEHGFADDRIDQGEAADDAAAATEYNLLVEHVLIVLARQHEPSLTTRRVVDVVTRVRPPPDVVHVTRNGVPVCILEGADQEAAMASHTREHLPVARLSAALGLKHARRILKAEAESLINVGHPFGQSLAALRRHRQGETGDK